jgi:hypothetical protein
MVLRFEGGWIALIAANPFRAAVDLLASRDRVGKACDSPRRWPGQDTSAASH